MLSHRHQDKEVDAPQMDGRGPVMSASAGSNRTAAFDESPGILGFVSRRFRRSKRKKDKNLGGGPSQHSSGHGAVSYDGSDDSSSSSSSHDSRSESSPGRHGGNSREKMASSPTHTTRGEDERSQATAETRRQTQDESFFRQAAAEAEVHHETGTGKVHVAPSSSDSTHSSDTEYATPSTKGDGAGSAEANTRAKDYRSSSSGPAPASTPPAHALTAETHDRGNRAERHEKDNEAAAASDVHRDKTTPKAESASSSPSSSAASSASKRTSSHSPSSATPTTSSSSADDDDSDDENDSGGNDGDDDEEEDNGDGVSVGRVYSKMTAQSEAPSSRAPFSNSGMRHHTLVSPASAAYYAPTRDVRSSLVSTIDVDVAVVQEQRRQRQHQLYLHAALYQRLSLHTPSTGGSTTAPSSFSPSLTPAQSNFLRQRADAVYQRHMDAIVEQYLSAPRYRTALAQFRKHLSPPEQQMRTKDAHAQYFSATEIVTRPSSGAAGASTSGSGAGPSDSAEAFFNGIATAGHESDWWRVGSGAAGDGGLGSANRGGDATPQPVNSGADRYRLEKTDLELLAGDTARRARLLDDTLPWRPVDFDANNIRLEALEHLQADLTGTDAVTSAGTAPAVGGSVNLLIEVLLLTEMDVPFTSTIPMVNYTNVFLLLASLFVQSEVLLTKLIRFYRSVRAWEAEVEDTSRAVYLERRVLQCILVYCRVHETDLTLSCLQRLAIFVASEGFLGPSNVLNDAIGKNNWPCQEGVYCASRRRAAAYASVVGSGTAANGAAAAGLASPTGASPGSTLHSFRHFKRHGFVDPRRPMEGGAAGLFPQRNAAFDPAALLNPATRAPLQNEVAQTLLEFIVYLQRTIVVYYRPIDISATCRQALPFTPDGPLRMYVDTAVLRPGLGCTSSSLRTAMTADPRLSPEPLTPSGSLGARFSERLAGSSQHPSSSSSPSRDQRLGAASALNRMYGGATSGSPRPTSQASSEALPSLQAEGRGATISTTAAAAAAAAYPLAGSPRLSTLESTVLQRPLAVVDIDAEHLSRQVCLLSFSLFTAVHIRELLNNAWTDSSMKVSVSTRLTELMEFSSHLQRWTAAVIATPATWAECQRGLRYFLEVCRMLYEQQNYEMAAAILEGLRHPAVEYLERAYGEARGQNLLTSVERRELETLQELMDPFASYSPSSLYSVTARTVGDMETPMIPLLSPILGVIFRSEDIKGTTVSIRSSDGQAVVNWSKIIGLGKMVVLWMRCQYTPFAFPVDPEIQEFLWSTMKHQWTDALLMRAARRTKQ